MAKVKRLSSRRADRGPIQISIILVGLCVLSGLYGWLEVSYEWPDALYRAFLALGASDIYTNTNEWCRPVQPGSECEGDTLSLTGILALNFARYTGLLFLFGAVLYALAKLLSRTFAQFRIELGEHRLVCIGEGDLVSEAFRAEAATGLRRVWLGAPFAQNELRSATMPWDGSIEPARAVAKASRGSEQVLICAGNDISTLKHVTTVVENVTDSKEKPVSITAIFEKPGASEEALRMAKPAFENPKSALRCLTYSHLAAREVLRAEPPFVLADQLGQTEVHVMVIGFGRVGQSLLNDIAINSTTSQFGKPHVTVVDPGVGNKRDWMRTAIPELDEICHLNTIEGGFGEAFEHPKATLDDLPALTAVYICVGSGDLAIAALDGLRIWLRNQKRCAHHIFIRTNSIDFGTGGKQEDGSALRSFGTFKAILREAQYLSDDPDMLARRVHEVYREHALKRNPTQDIKSWLDLAEPFKASSRAVADHLQTKIFSANLDDKQCIDEHGHIRLGCNAVLYTSKDEVEALAALEHGRFVTERRTAGWSMGERDDALRKDPNFIDYSDLPEELKSFDRLIVELSKTLLRDG